MDGRWMDGWMNGGWTDGRTVDGRMDGRWLDGHADWTDRRTDKQADRQSIG